MKIDRSDWTFFAVIALLFVQLGLFVLSLDALMVISIFCAASASQFPPILSYIHLAYFGLFFFGIASLLWSRGRKAYLTAIGLALLALPLQVWLLENGKLRCDGF